jgi:aryl-alcohol dehydrogenase
MKIEAAIARTGQADFSIEAVDIDAPREDEILVRIVAVGLCHTDLVAQTGAIVALPAVLGHEGAGIVEAVGAKVSKVAPGDRVAITFRSCGGCGNCARGDAAYCHYFVPLNYMGTRPDGSRAIRGADEALSANFFGQSSFASHALTFERNVVKLPEEMPLHLAGPLGCGIQTGAGAIMRALACPAGSSLLIIGGGTVGLSAVMGAAIQGCAAVIVAEPHAERRALAIELGATHVIDPADEPDLAAAVRRIVPAGADFALDTSGHPEAQRAAVAALAPRGTLGLVGISPPGAPPPGEANDILTRGIAIRGIIEGDSDPDAFLPELIDLYLAGRLPFDRLVRTYPFAAINEAISDQHAGRCVKALLLMEAPRNGD